MPIIGTCSKCGGPVETPTIWNGINPPVPTCRVCGATKKKPFGPVIDMDDPKPSIGSVKEGPKLGNCRCAFNCPSYPNCIRGRYHGDARPFSYTIPHKTERIISYEE